MSAVDAQTHLPPAQDHPRSESPDVIDVDAFDADDVVYVGSARPSQRRRVGEDGSAVPVTREVIHITDSEDDNEVQFVGHNPARPRPPLVRRERIFSPPPPPQVDVIPPVPRIPQRFLALHPRPSPGPIIPNEDPFPFEADMRPMAEQPAPVAAAPSHHVPSMGFGGALLAGVRRLHGPRITSHLPERRNTNLWGITSSFVLRWGDPFDVVQGGEDDAWDGFEFLPEEDDQPYGHRRVRNQIEQVFKQRDRDGQAGPDYKPEYTHPDRPLPGFTHDFSPSSPSSPVTEDDTSASRRASGSGSRPYEATLVCVACRDPLVLGASDVGEGRSKRKLWGLHCGHLLDGKCIEQLMAPPEPGRVAPEHAPSSSQDTVATDAEAGSVRSRLRPRRAALAPPATPSNRRTASVRTQASLRSNRKGKGKMKAPEAPVVEAEHEWGCPVSGCGRVHLSLLVDGRWRMDEKRGAIAVFV